jgi:hypothetical protein
MKLVEIVDLSNEQKNIQRLKANAKREADIAKAAQERLNMKKAQEKLAKLRPTALTVGNT